MYKKRYDFIIIGTGAGGGTLAHCLSSTGKSILLLERGTYLPREKSNWEPFKVQKERHYMTSEKWYDTTNRAIAPTTGYWVGGNTKLYGAAMFRFREQDFEEVKHKGGISPQWSFSYSALEPYYTQAEKLYQVRGQRGRDPNEPPASENYPYAAVQHSPEIESIAKLLQERHSLKPFPLPLAVKINDREPHLSQCIRCNTCEGFPCLLNAKSDSDINCVRPSLAHANITLLTGAKVQRLLTNNSGTEIVAVETEINGQIEKFAGDIVIVSCGAINSAVLLLKSWNDRHPNGLANTSGQVGRNLMKHINGGIICLTDNTLPLHNFHKTLAITDFYWGDETFPLPMGSIQTLGKLNGTLIALSKFDRYNDEFENIARSSIGWWLTSEDLPNFNNQVTIKGEKIILNYRENNSDAFKNLVSRWQTILNSLFPLANILTRKVPLEVVTHQCGTCRFGVNKHDSVLDLNCRTHDVDNLYVVDSSFFPSSAAVNPSLTIIANALRVGEHLIKRTK